MKLRSLTFVVVMFAVLAAVKASAFEVPDEPIADFQKTECWVAVSGPAATDCGWLVVPERWERPGSKRLRLPVVIFRAREPDPSLAPVVYLSGGPGYPALGRDGADISGWRRGADHLFPGRTLIMFDQRGTGSGSPRLACPEGEDPRLWWDLSTDPQTFAVSDKPILEAYDTCRQRLLDEGHDLSAFNSRQSAADVEALRRALSLERVVLFGISYGTRLALTVMRYYPAHIDAAVLDSVFPPQVVDPSMDGEAYGTALDRLFAACAAHAGCAAAYPDLETRFLALLADLKRQPVILEIDNLQSREPLFARIDHHVFLAILRREMYHSSRISGLPAMIAGAARGEAWRLRPHAENTFYGDNVRAYDLGMSLSVSCRHLAGLQLRKSDVDGTGPYPHLGEFIAWARDFERELCQVWSVERAKPEETSAVVSAVPSLLLAGGLDGSTPVEFAKLAAETLSAAHLFVFPANAHGQFSSSKCAREVLQAFLRQPKARPDPPCLRSLRKPAFLTLGGG